MEEQRTLKSSVPIVKWWQPREPPAWSASLRAFVLKVSSWFPNQVSINLPQTNVILCYDKSKAPPHDFHPLRSRSCLRRRQVSSSQFLGARALDSFQLSSLKEPGTQHPTGLQVPQATQTVGANSLRLHPMQTAMAIKSQRQGEGRDLSQVNL